MTAKWCTFCPRRSFTYPGATTQPPKPDKDRPSALPRQAAISRRRPAAALTSKGLRRIVCWSPACCLACNALPHHAAPSAYYTSGYVSKQGKICFIPSLEENLLGVPRAEGGLPCVGVPSPCWYFRLCRPRPPSSHATCAPASWTSSRRWELSLPSHTLHDR
jgi:hypothetical protein